MGSYSGAVQVEASENTLSSPQSHPRTKTNITTPGWEMAKVKNIKEAGMDDSTISPLICQYIPQKKKMDLGK